MQKAHILKLQKIFNIIDGASYYQYLSHLLYLIHSFLVDNSESIFIDEFFELLSYERTAYTDKLFKCLGINAKKNTLKFHEFVTICAFYCALTKDDILQFCYEIYDTDNSGLLDIKKFQGR